MSVIDDFACVLRHDGGDSAMCGGDDFEHHIVHILRAVADVQPQLWLGVRGDSAARDHTTCTGDISQRA